MVADPLDPERRAALLAGRLAALASGLPGPAAPGGDDLERRPFGPGAGLIEPINGRAWLLLVDRPARAVGPALAWSRQQSVADIHLLVDRPLGRPGGRVASEGASASVSAATVARRAGQFRTPPTVWVVEGTEARRAEPGPPPESEPPPAGALALAERLAAAGLEVVVEDGAVRGEILGLEVAVVVVDPDGSARVEVGVGRHDREAFALLHGGLPEEQALRSVTEAVRAHRRPGAPPHPLNRLAPERWLRAWATDRSGPLADWDLRPIPGPEARRSVKDTAPAFAMGRRPDGHPVVVAFSTGIDLDLVPTAADAREAVDPDADLVLVVPQRDAHPVTQWLADALVRPAEVRTVPDAWRS